MFLFGVDRTEKGYLTNTQLAQHSYRQDPVALLTSLLSSNAGMKQYECGRTQPLLCKGHDHRETSGQNLKSEDKTKY
jgi:hypothetical protein